MIVLERLLEKDAPPQQHVVSFAGNYARSIMFEADSR